MSDYRANAIEDFEEFKKSNNFKVYVTDKVEFADHSYAKCIFCGRESFNIMFGAPPAREYIMGKACFDNNKYYFKYGLFSLFRKKCPLKEYHFHFTCKQCKTHWVYFKTIPDYIKVISI